MNPVLDMPDRAATMASPKHQYYVCLSYNDEPLPWDLADETQDFAPAYLQRVLRVMEQELQAEGLTFYITWKLDELPSYGDDVVAIVMGDEWSRYPRYAHKVRATFKCYGTRPSLGCNPFLRPSYLNTLLAIKLLRTGVHYLPGAARHTWQRGRHALRGAALPPIFDLPLGYGNQLDLPIKPITDRDFDLFFAGSVTHDTFPVWSPKFWLQSPKTVSRSQMMRVVEQMQRDHAALRVQLATTSSFALNAIYYGTADPTEVLDAARYSEAMMNTKICLVPRGTSPETFRFFEAMRYGCVLVTEKQPSRWFYDGSPAIEVEDWQALEGIVEELLLDEALLQRKHQEALAWWENVCSERAVGSYMAARLQAEMVGA